MNTEKLGKALRRRGITPQAAAEHLNMTEKTFVFKLITGDFGTDEVQGLIALLGIRDPAKFFYPKSNLKSSYPQRKKGTKNSSRTEGARRGSCKT